MLKVGRYTAALLLLSVGIALLLDQSTGSDYLLEWMTYWPVLLITLGLEYLVMSICARDGERKLRFDLGALILSVIITVAVGGFFQGKAFLEKVDIPLDGFPISWGVGDKYEKPIDRITLTEETEQLVVENNNGDVTLLSGTGDQAVVKATVVLYNQSESKASEIVEQSEVKITTGKTLKLEAAGASYSAFIGTQKARIDLEITLPRDRALDVNIKTSNGDVTTDSIAIRDSWTAKTANGDVVVYRLEGDVKAETMNGDITIKEIAGATWVSTSNGDVEAQDIEGKTEMKTMNGDVEAQSILGDLYAKTTNGDIDVSESLQAITLETSNGDIVAGSRQVGGDWSIDTSHGEIELSLPQDGDYTMDAQSSYGDVETDIEGLNAQKRSITGKVGSGKHSIQAESMSDIQIRTHP